MIILNDDTKALLDKLRANLPQAILLSGPRGVGLKNAALYLAEDSIAETISPTNSKGEIDDTAGSIRIDEIRALYEKSRSINTRQMIFIIDNADRMQIPAANAFLKLLEEPNDKLSFILTSHYPQKIIDTIKSRAQEVIVKPIAKNASQKMLDNTGVDTKKSAQIMFVASGLPALISNLINDQAKFEELIALAADAKVLVSSNSYDKSLIVSRYSDRAKALELLNVIERILRQLLSSTPETKTLVKLDKISVAYDRIAQNGNVKANLATLVV